MMSELGSSSWSASSVICQFPIPPSSTPSYVAAPSTSYTAPTIISLGEEYTDATLPTSRSSSTPRGPSSSYLDFDEDEEEEEEEDGMMMMIDDDGDSDDEDSSDESEDEGESDSEDYPVPHTPSTSASSSHNRYSRRRSQEQRKQHSQQSSNQSLPALWHAEHARLLHIHTAVLDSEREARHRELKLESEVARIKNDLARLKQVRANNNNATTTTTTTETKTTSPTSAQQSALGSRTFGPRGPRPKPIFQSPSLPHYTLTTSPTGSSFDMEEEVTATSTTTNPAASPVACFRDEEEEDEATAALLSNHLSEARSLRAQERQKRRKENERIRELSMLLTLGSEVRKWEERLAWTNRARAASSPSSDDIHLSSSNVNHRKRKNEDDDTDPDPRAKRLSRSASLPTRAFNGIIHNANSNNNVQQQQQQHRSGPPSPALPSLALSPLWRVSAEMILRRRSLSERPRRTPTQIVSGRVGFVSSPVSRAVTTAAAVAAPAPTPAPVAPVTSVAPVSSLVDAVPTSSTSTSSSSTQITATATTPTTATSPCTLSRPAQTVRGPRERSTQISSTTVAGTASNGRAYGSLSATGPRSLSRKARNLNQDNNSNGNKVEDDNNRSDNQDDNVSLTRDGTSSVATSALVPLSSPHSGKRYSVPPPITIPPADSFCSNTTAVSGGMTTTDGGVSTGSKSESFAIQQKRRALPATTPSPSFHYSSLSKSAPARPSALKWAFTADDLERELESERKGSQEPMEIDEGARSPSLSCASSSSSSSEESGSEAGSSSVSSSASSSDSSSSSMSVDSQDGEASSQAAVERRGRARFSWRKSLPKEKDLNVDGNVAATSTTTITTTTTTAMVAAYDA
ncbi:hypothetical protein FRB91_000874 [Serendipita sp. 411]|nr:hypothetical protein FRB91_000874 [Serendipita sp. 411]